MDLKLVREAAIEATNRAFWDRDGFVPDEDSDEWEDEYRRQFELAKKRHAADRPAVSPPIIADAPPEEEPGWAALTGPPTQIRWAAALRADRLKEIRDPGIRNWLATTWTKSKSWIDTSNLPTAIFLQKNRAALCAVPSAGRRTGTPARRRATGQSRCRRRNSPPNRGGRDHRRRIDRADRYRRPAAGVADQGQARGARYCRAQPAGLRDRRSGGADGPRKGRDRPRRIRYRARRGARRATSGSMPGPSSSRSRRKP